MKLFVDDIRTPPAGAEWLLARSVNEAIGILENIEIEEASLDYDMGYFSSEGGYGVTLVNWMAKNNKWPTKAIYLHSSSYRYRLEMKEIIDANCPYEAIMRSVD
jgi:hypothetical protein